MKYVTQNTNIKVPAVYDWNGTAQNPIKTPYIFMEWLPGQHLYKVWDGLTIRQKIGVLRQIVGILFQLWTQCRFKEIGCLYMDKQSLSSEMSTFRIGPVVSSLFYSKGRDSIPSSTGPFKSLQEFYGALIQKEKEFFEIHGAQELLPLKESIIDWEFSRTGTLWDLCKYPIWIQEIDELSISDANLQKNDERRILRKFFYEEILFYHYGSEAKANIKLADPIMRLFWRPSTKVQIPSEETIQDILSDTEVKVSNHYVASVYCELKSRGYNFTWQQTFVIAFHMLNTNESSPKEKFV
ncbi:unnamed protein product [Rhizophagus irregularis]|nr:unnamed protein product [Rhizophagus irregularis]CAB5350121.1 unnamed protein product [Rhizophagus irregularis]